MHKLFWINIFWVPLLYSMQQYYPGIVELTPSLYAQQLASEDGKIINSVCVKAQELCQKAYLDPNHYQCHYNYFFEYTCGWRIHFNIEEKISGNILCVFEYDRNTKQLKQLQ